MAGKKQRIEVWEERGSWWAEGAGQPKVFAWTKDDAIKKLLAKIGPNAKEEDYDIRG